MDVANDLSVPIELRSHEREQLNEYLPNAKQSYEAGDRDDEAATVSTLIDALHDSSDEYVSFTVEQWRTCVSALSRVDSHPVEEQDGGSSEVPSHRDDGLRPWWLQKKVVNRLNERVEELQ